MIGKLSGMTMNRDGSQNITVTVQADFSEMYDKLADKEVEVDIKKASSRRSLDANAFFWHLCSEIAKASSKYTTDGKYGIYQEAIRAKGEFDILAAKPEAVESFERHWSDHGKGWFVDVIGDCEDGRKELHAYYGSSTYSSAAMSKVIDYVVNIAEDLGIPTITPKELEKLLGRWAKKKDEI